MYTPPPFAEDDPEVVAAMIARARLGALVTHGPQGLSATHLPFLYDREAGRLLAHLARPNPHPALAGDGEAMVIFSGPEAYVSPGWYPSKADTGRQVPTWNYEAVHVYGRLEWFQDRDRLRDLLDRLTAAHEAGRSAPWALSDAPEYVERLLGGIVGVELSITRIEAKRKLSQNKPERDRAGVADGLAASEDPRDRTVAALMRPEKA